MPKVKPAGADRLMNDYTFEEYNDARETRAWYEKFLREHNGKRWRKKLNFSLTDMITGNTPTAANGETTRIFWYRIRCSGVLVGYADAKIHPFFNGRKVISDVWVIPEFRNRGHFHRSFPGLVEHTDAVGICIMLSKSQLYGYWFESFGFDWLSPATPGGRADQDDMVVFMTTRDACKDMLRFVIKYVDGQVCPSSVRGRTAYEEVRRELEEEASRGTR